jgi:hypothetical protein
MLDEWKEPFEEQVFEEFGYNGQDWPVGGRAWGGFPGLRMGMICATFHWLGK